MKKILALFSLLGLSLLQAEDYDDTFKIRAGAYLVSGNDITIAATTSNLIGVNINMQDDLGMKSSTETFRIDGYYRFNDVHKVEYAYYKINTDSSRTATKDITFNGTTYSGGVRIDSDLNMDIYKINYAYSFYHNEDVELSVTAGLHLMDVDMSLNGSGSINGAPEEANTDTKSTIFAPLPVLGFRLDYTIFPEFHVRGSLDYFNLDIDQFSGNFVDFLVAAEYQVLDNVGIGAGLNSTSLKVNFKTLNGAKLDINQDIRGFLVYLSYNY